jgi:hypothetical protein
MQCIHALFLLDVHIFNHFSIIIVPFHGQASCCFSSRISRLFIYLTHCTSCPHKSFPLNLLL